MARIIDLHLTDLQQFSQNFWLDAITASAGIGFDGAEQVLYSENRRWIGQVDLVTLYRGDTRKARVIGDQLRGRANILRVHVCNTGTLVFRGDVSAFYRSVGVTEAEEAQGYTTYSDGFKFTDGTGFALPDYAEPAARGSAPVGASSLHVTGTIGRSLVPGAYFSSDDYLYRVESNDDGRLTFNPPLRAGIADGARVEVSRPKVQMRLGADAGWRPFVEGFRMAQPMQIGLVEAMSRD